MPAKLNVYNLGSNGVNVDANPVQLEDGELTKSQNAIHDPLGAAGGLRKRAGLTKVNSVAAAGAIRGGMGIPLSIPGPIIGPGGTAPAAARTGLIGRALASSDAATGWYTTTNGFATAAQIGIPFFKPVGRGHRSTMAAPAPGKWSTNPPAGVQYKGKLYYAADNYVTATDPPTIYMWDGATLRQICKVPGFYDKTSPTPVFQQTRAVMHMIVGGDGKLYFSTFGTGTGVATYEGSVYQLDVETGNVLSLAHFPNSLPNALIWYNNKLWVGTYTGNSGTTLATIEWMRPGIDTGFTVDFTTIASPAVHNFASYKGLLYATLEGGTAGAAPLVKVRSALGVWTTALTGTASALATYLGAVVFKGNLYVSYFNDSVAAALIQKFDGTSWTTAFTGSAANDTLPYYFFQDTFTGTLYAVSPYGDAKTVLTTTTGASWTNRVTAFDTLDELIPIFATIVT